MKLRSYRSIQQLLRVREENVGEKEREKREKSEKSSKQGEREQKS